MKNHYSLALFLAAAAALPTHAAPLSWDPSLTPLSPSGGAGTWDLSNARWSNGAADVIWTDSSGTLDTANFGGAAGTVTLGTNLGARGIVFTTAGYTLTGSTLSLGVSGINASALASGTTTINSALSLAAGAQIWNAGIGSTVAINGAVTRSGGAVVSLIPGGSYTSSSLVNSNAILGPWANFAGSGTAANNSANGFTYATVSGGNLVPYTSATPLTGTTAWGGIPSGGSGTVNYDISSGGTLGLTGLGRNVNTLRYTGSGATQQANFGAAAGADIFTVNGIMNAGTGPLAIGTATTIAAYNGLNVIIGTSQNLILAATTSNIVIQNIIKNNGANPGSVTVTGAANVTLGGANTYSGGTFVSSGNLILLGGANPGSGPIFVGEGSTFNNGGVVGAQAVSGGGAFTSTAATSLSGNWSGFTGTYTHNTTTASSVFNTTTSTSPAAAYVIASVQGGAQGMITATNGDYALQLGSLSGVANSMFRGGNVATGTATLEIGHLDTDSTFAGIIANGATKVIAFTKVGTGTMTLSGANTYTGATRIAEGTLNLTGSLGITPVTLATGAALSGEGPIGGSLTLENGSDLRVNAATAEALSVTGDLTLNGVTEVLLDGPLALTSGGTTIPLINYTGTLTGSAANLSFAGLSTFRNPTLSTASLGQIQLVLESENLIWSGATAVWDINGSSNWNSSTAKYFDGDSVVFNNSGTTKNVILNSSVIPAAVTFSNSIANNYTLGGTGAITGLATFTKNGSGTLTLNSPQQHSGPTFVDEGILAFGVNDAMPVGNLYVSGGSSVLNLGNNLSATVASFTLENGGTLTGSGSSSLASSSDFNLLDGTVSGVLDGSGGAVKAGLGTVTLLVPAAYAGTTTISDGVLLYGINDAIADGNVTLNGTGAVLDLGANHVDTVGTVTLAAGTITGTGSSTLTSTTALELRSGLVEIVLAGDVPLNKSTAGTVTLAAGNTYTGETTIGINAAGTRIGAIRATANHALGTGNVNIGPGGNDATARLELEGGISLNNPLLLSSRNNSSAAIQNLSGNNALSGILSITTGGGTNTIQSDSGTLTFSNAVTNITNAARVVTFQGDGDTVVSGVIEDGSFSGSLGLIKDGPGTLTLSGPNTYTRDTTVNGGTLGMTQPTLADSATVNIASDAVLNLSHGATDIVDRLFIDGLEQSPGTWGSLASAASNKTARITGSGILSVTNGISGYTSWASLLGLTPGVNDASTTDAESDGFDNGTEFMLGGHPLDGSNNPKIHSFIADTSADGDTLPELVMTIAVPVGTPAFSAGAPQSSATFSGYVVSVRGSSDLAAFAGAVTPVDPLTTGLPPAPVQGGITYEYRSFSLGGSNGTPGKGFLQVSVTHP